MIRPMSPDLHRWFVLDPSVQPGDQWPGPSVEESGVTVVTRAKENKAESQSHVDHTCASSTASSRHTAGRWTSMSAKTSWCVCFVQCARRVEKCVRTTHGCSTINNPPAHNTLSIWEWPAERNIAAAGATGLLTRTWLSVIPSFPLFAFA